MLTAAGQVQQLPQRAQEALHPAEQKVYQPGLLVRPGKVFPPAPAHKPGKVYQVQDLRAQPHVLRVQPPGLQV